MKKIKSVNITKAYTCLILFAVFLVAGFYEGIFFIPSVAALIGYVIIDRKYLRCPYCSGFTNLDRLSYAKKHIYYCNYCGKRIEIEK